MGYIQLFQFCKEGYCLGNDAQYSDLFSTDSFFTSHTHKTASTKIVGDLIKKKQSINNQFLVTIEAKFEPKSVHETPLT